MVRVTMTTPVFRITSDELKKMIDVYSMKHIKSDNTTAKLLYQYWFKSLETGVFEISQKALEMNRAHANRIGLHEWSQVLSDWSKKI